MQSSSSTKIVLNLHHFDKNNLQNFDIPTEFWQKNWETVPFSYSYFDTGTLFWQKNWETVPFSSPNIERNKWLIAQEEIASFARYIHLFPNFQNRPGSDQFQYIECSKRLVSKKQSKDWFNDNT